MHAILDTLASLAGYATFVCVIGWAIAAVIADEKSGAMPVIHEIHVSDESDINRVLGDRFCL